METTSNSVTCTCTCRRIIIHNYTSNCKNYAIVQILYNARIKTCVSMWYKYLWACTCIVGTGLTFISCNLNLFARKLIANRKVDENTCTLYPGY